MSASRAFDRRVYEALPGIDACIYFSFSLVKSSNMGCKTELQNFLGGRGVTRYYFLFVCCCCCWFFFVEEGLFIFLILPISNLHRKILSFILMWIFNLTWLTLDRVVETMSSKTHQNYMSNMLQYQFSTWIFGFNRGGILFILKHIHRVLYHLRDNMNYMNVCFACI